LAAFCEKRRFRVPSGMAHAPFFYPSERKTAAFVTGLFGNSLEARGHWV
jgi:hypothetical protein